MSVGSLLTLVQVSDCDEHDGEKSSDAYGDAKPDVARRRVASVAFNFQYIAIQDCRWRVGLSIANYKLIIASLSYVTFRPGSIFAKYCRFRFFGNAELRDLYLDTLGCHCLGVALFRHHRQAGGGKQNNACEYVSKIRFHL